MPNVHRKRRARESELAVARHLAERIWPEARANGASLPGSDVVNIPVDIEVKARRDFSPLAWLRQSRKRRPGGFVVMRADGQGVETVGDWFVIKRLDDEIDLRLQASAGLIVGAPMYPPFYPPVITYQSNEEVA